MEKPNELKKFYWIKLKDSFMTSDKVDFLMSQKNGAQYVVLYQMLCLKTINTGGEFSRQLGEIIIPFDTEKIQRDCKYFDIDTVRIALELFVKLGLVYEQNNGILAITNFTELVGSECSSAQRVREWRARDNEKKKKKALQSNAQNNAKVTQEIEIRDKSIEIDIKDIYKEEEDSSNTYSDDKEILSSPPPTPLSVDFSYQQALALYKQYSPTLYSKEFDAGLNDDYKNAQALFLATDEGFTINDAKQLFSKAEASAWLTTEAKNITFEWLLKKRKLVINGKYDNSEPKEKTDSKQEKYGVTRRLF